MYVVVSGMYLLVMLGNSFVVFHSVIFVGLGLGELKCNGITRCKQLICF